MLKAWWPSCSHGDGDVVKGESERSLLHGQNWKAKSRESFHVCVDSSRAPARGGLGKKTIIWVNRWCPCSQASPPESQRVQRGDPPKPIQGASMASSCKGAGGCQRGQRSWGRHRAPATTTDGFSSPLIEVCKCSALLINTVSISRL